MIKKLFTKYILEVVPSIVATVVGAYIVTHYINAKSEADKPKAEIATPAETSKTVAPQTLKADDSAEKAKAESAKADAARLRAEKLAADKAAAERAASERAEAAAKKAAAEKLANEKAASEKREKALAKSAPVTPAASEANATLEEKRDANDMARAAIERLRSAEPKVEIKAETPRAPETARVEEPAKSPERIQEKARVNSVVYAPAAAPQPSIQPLPPAVTVAPPPSEINVAPLQPKQPEIRADDGSRPTPPANIPSRPLDIRAHERDRSVAEGVVSAARSVFQAVMPDSSN